MKKSPRGDRGVSILGALVVALMLGAGSVATFELASPSLSSSVSESQVAAPTAAEKAAAEAAKKKKEEEDRKKLIAQKCKEAKESLAKSKEATTKHTAKTFENNVDPVEPSRCVGAIKTGPDVKCVGLSSEIKLLSKGQVRVTSKPDSSVEPGKCRAQYCSIELGADKKAFEECSTKGDIDGYKPLKKQARETKLQDLGPNAKNNLIDNAPIGGAEGKALADALRPDEQKAQVELEKAKVETKGEYDTFSKIKCLADDTVCKDLKEAARKDLVEAQKREAEAQKRYDDLRRQIKRLEGGQPPSQITERDLDDGRIERRDEKGNVEICDKDGKNCKPAPTPPITTSGPSGPPNNSTFPGQQSSGGGGLPQGLQQLLGGGQPQAGNQTPKPPGTCSAGQTLCSGNTLYSRNNQCVDTPVQYCQYGCAQQQSSSGSSFLSFFGGGSSGSSQCAPSPQQNQNCTHC